MMKMADKAIGEYKDAFRGVCGPRQPLMHLSSIRGALFALGFLLINTYVSCCLYLDCLLLILHEIMRSSLR